MSLSFRPGISALKRAQRFPLTWVLCGAALLRLLYFFQVRGDATFTVPIWDAAVFDEMGRNLAAGLGTGYPKAYFFGPLYPYFLGAIYAIPGAGAQAAVFIQHAIGVLLCGLTYQLGHQWFNRKVGLLAACLLAFSGLQIYFEGTLLMEILVSTLLAGFCFLLTRLNSRPSFRGFLLAGLLLGLASVGRPTLFLLVPLVLPMVLLHHSLGRRTALITGVVFLTGTAIAPMATLIRNFAAEGVIVPITSSGGYNFYLGNSGTSENLFFENRRLATDSSWNGENTAEEATGRQLDSAEISRYWFSRAAADIRSHPVRWAGRYLNKIQLFLNGQDVPQIESYRHARRRSSVLGLTPVGLHLLMALSIAGLAGAVAQRRRLTLLFVVTGTLVLGTAAFFVTTRYRVVALPYLCLFAGSYLIILWEYFRERAWRKFFLYLAIGAGAAVFTLPARFPLNERTRDYAQFLHDGFKYAKVEEYSEALDAYAQARDVWPEDYESYLGMGQVHRSLGQLPQSIQELETAMRLNTHDAEVPYHLGITLHQMNRFLAAEQFLRRSLEMSPRRALTHAYLGLTLAAQGKFEHSQESFETSLDLDPFQPFTHSNFGTLLAMRDERENARGHFLRALDLDPDFLPARKNLAFIYLDDGDPVSAARELRRVLDQSPDDQQAREVLDSLSN